MLAKAFQQHLATLTNGRPCSSHVGLPGDRSKMGLYQRYWKETREKLDLLRSNPKQFIKKHGYMYDFRY